MTSHVIKVLVVKKDYSVIEAIGIADAYTWVTISSSVVQKNGRKFIEGEAKDVTGVYDNNVTISIVDYVVNFN